MKLIKDISNESWYEEGFFPLLYLIEEGDLITAVCHTGTMKVEVEDVEDEYELPHWHIAFDVDASGSVIEPHYQVDKTYKVKQSFYVFYDKEIGEGDFVGLSRHFNSLLSVKDVFEAYNSDSNVGLNRFKDIV